MEKDYLLNYLRVTAANKQMLMVTMNTKEFGELKSRMLAQVADEKINRQLLDSLADELIDEYENEIANRRTVIAVS